MGGTERRNALNTLSRSRLILYLRRKFPDLAHRLLVRRHLKQTDIKKAGQRARRSIAFFDLP
jgi:hypothetical protein